MTRSTKKTSKNNHRRHEQANRQNGTSRIAAMPKLSGRVTLATFKDIVALAEHCIYLIVRIRPNPGSNPPTFRVRTLGSGFVAARYRMVTAAHVLNSTTPGADELARHQPGDIYQFIRREQNGFCHRHWGSYGMDDEIFIYPGKDLGIIHLKNNFYAANGISENDFLQTSQEFCGLATPVGVLGYPLAKLQFENNDLDRPQVGDILPRVDQGIINTCYMTADHIQIYEFTMAFNNGNSGGPIVNLENGTVISWVHGYKKTDIDLKEKDIPSGFMLREYNQPTYKESVQATYSIGVATACAVSELRSHDIIV